MLAPLYKFGNMSEFGMIIVALLVGFIFGYIVENVGFANAKNFTAVFYGNDWRVHKVIFSTVIITMILLYFSFYLGFLDISMLYVPQLKLKPIIIGGAVLGAGLVIGGYCPGTSVVASMTRKMDAWFYILGYFIGIWLYAEFYPSFSHLMVSKNRGNLTLSELFKLPYGYLAFIIIVYAIVTFFVLSKIEGKIYKSKVL
jgi:uncharacterized membrane protein YedE/YeeE